MFYTTQEVLQRGWTKTLIKKFLVKPDRIKTFHWGKQFFYAQAKISEIETTAEFIKAQRKAIKRQSTAVVVVERRRLDRIDYLKNRMPVRVRIISLDDVTKKAVESFNAHTIYKSQFHDDQIRLADESSDKQFLDRIRVNHIRHHLTDYEHLLHSNIGKIAREECEPIIFKRVFDAISDAYPELRDECDRQLRRKLAGYGISEQIETEQMILPLEINLPSK